MLFKPATNVTESITDAMTPFETRGWASSRPSSYGAASLELRDELPFVLAELRSGWAANDGTATA